MGQEMVPALVYHHFVWGQSCLLEDVTSNLVLLSSLEANVA